jgi:hypothetical protein
MDTLNSIGTSNVLKAIIIALLLFIILRENTATASKENFDGVVNVNIVGVNGMSIMNNEIPVKIKQ